MKEQNSKGMALVKVLWVFISDVNLPVPPSLVSLPDVSVSQKLLVTVAKLVETSPPFALPPPTNPVE